MSDQTPPPPGEPPAGGPQGVPGEPYAQQPPPQQPPPEYPQQGYPQQGYAQPGPYTMPPQPQQDPGKVLGIVGLVLAFFTALIGMILSIVAYRMSKKAGFKNTPALVGIIVGAIFTVIAVIGTIAAISIGAAALHSACQQLGPGVHNVNGTRITCP